MRSSGCIRWLLAGASLCGSLVAGCGSPAPEGGPQKIGSATLTFTPRPDPPREGLGSAFVVTVREGEKPVRGATVRIQLYYRSLNQTGPDAAAVEESPGVYVASEMVTGKAGRWEAEVTFNGAGLQGTAKFPFKVVPDGG